MGFGTILHRLCAHWSRTFSPNVFQALSFTLTSPLSSSPASPQNVALSASFDDLLADIIAVVAGGR
jgi:hypothetical protein